MHLRRAGPNVIQIAALFYPESGKGATGAVLGDSAGNFKGGRARWYGYGLDALTMEARACKDGSHPILARDSGIQRLVLETDSQELVKIWEMTKCSEVRSCISPIIRDIRELSAVFLDFSLVYTNRSCNQVAHVLDRQVSDDNRMGEWHSSAPSCISHLSTEDCNPVIV